MEGSKHLHDISDYLKDHPLHRTDDGQDERRDEQNGNHWVCLLRSCWDHKSASEKQLACKDGLVCNCSWRKNLDHNLDFHVIYTNLETCPCQSGDKRLMPWRRCLKKKKKSKKEFGQLSGEELFKPITTTTLLWSWWRLSTTTTNIWWWWWWFATTTNIWWWCCPRGVGGTGGAWIQIPLIQWFGNF